LRPASKGKILENGGESKMLLSECLVDQERGGTGRNDAHSDHSLEDIETNPNAKSAERNIHGATH